MDVWKSKNFLCKAIKLILVPLNFRQIRIPKFSSALNYQINKETFKSFKVLQKSKDLYKHAEIILLNSLGLNNFRSTQANVSVKYLKDSFIRTGRLDAEYYQLKYEDYHNAIFSYPNGWKRLSEVCNLGDSNFTIHDEATYQYIELSNIDKFGCVTGNLLAKGKELPSRARQKVQENDVLISSIEGSLSSCAIVQKKFSNSLCSTGFYVINSDKINSETLLILFKSSLIQNILKQNCSGTILTAINKSEFLNIPLPIIDAKTQIQITRILKKSFALKAESQGLLKFANHVVEIAIEQGEAAAMKLLHATINKTWSETQLNLAID